MQDPDETPENRRRANVKEPSPVPEIYPVSGGLLRTARVDRRYVLNTDVLLFLPGSVSLRHEPGRILKENERQELHVK